MPTARHHFAPRPVLSPPMTSLDKIEQAPAGATTRGGRLAVELTETLKLAAPIALTQLGQIAMMTTDLALIGRLGDEAVAAAALAQYGVLRQPSPSAWGWCRRWRRWPRRRSARAIRAWCGARCASACGPRC